MQFNLTASITLLILISMQIASGIGLYQGVLTFKDYLSLWAPVLTLVIGYWFRGAQVPVETTK